ncbi:TPA: DUF115 domain-containing protein [Enterococcus faecium]|uniref:6-hydroxymethylpterin diphosphokinase MptE-like protein n=1 Tax=Enterococcus faecium TaxID=1352 RepID=UPI0002A25671|nr:6-hydroxymethylpterin diphosphokinase MptE-like protein [Enterococcus faecium]ELA59272.1 hypothetical protein OGG_03551 [Enterococcus faecium EnGen0013]EOF93737.1 hypothetical protein SKG_01154 [Enterococcus faecium EnGen0166]MDV7710307.1 DUF115 domain-containing protein [Enterococcus faecium]MDW3723005.1 6-hydroxymethylpterin diphosphokinase MptE-like protein [Enterococcus faecium]HAQ7384503.1 DUF115 domain-containing protein [Enterococcus faecium]
MDYHKIQLKSKSKISEETLLYKILYRTHRLVLRLFYGEYGIYRLKFLVEKFFRIKGIENQKYNEIRKIENLHKGKRCFIVATGPSLRIEDVEKLNGEITFGMNSLVSIFDKTDWRPTYYVVQDCSVWDRNKKMYFKEEKIKFLIGENVARYDRSANGKPNSIIYPLDLHNHDCVDNKDRSNPKRPKFSNDAYKGIEDGYTVTYSVIQLAVYMGFSEIYLLGVDCNYSGPTSHIGVEKGDNSLMNDLKRIGPEAQMLCSYAVARENLDALNVKIYNATRGGKMDVFDRVNFDEIQF